ncbi:MAG: hypothetical protein ACE5KA_03590 [Nitrososphaerales archaeon]
MQLVGGEEPIEGGTAFAILFAVSVILYLIAIILPLALKRTKILGGILIGLAFGTLISA